MELNSQTKINIRKKALKLIYDPICLLNLLYSKYGDIGEDYNLLIINQIVYDSSSHINIYFKEYLLFEAYNEYLKRWYNIDESSNRVPKLSDYYKNYHKFFCRPNFNDFIISDLMHNYGDDKAELFYKKNFKITNSVIDDKISEENNSSALTSIDNITSNKTIFTNKNKLIIEGNEKTNNHSISLSLNNTTIKIIENNKKNLISSRSIKNSFEEIVHNLVYYQKKKKTKNNNKNKKGNYQKTKNKLAKKPLNNDNKIIIKTNYNHLNNKEKRNSIQYLIVTKPNNYNRVKGINNPNILNSILKAFNSPKNGIKSPKNLYKNKLEENNLNCIGKTKITCKAHHQRNKTYNFSQNHSLRNHSGENMPHNLKCFINIKQFLKNTIQNKVKKNNIITFRDLVNHQNKKYKKNKTFDNNFYSQINQISSMPLLKYKISSSSNKKMNNQYKSNKNIIKNNNFIGSKFNLFKNLKSNPIVEKNKGKKLSSYNYYQNILTQILPHNKMRKNRNTNKISFGLNNNTSVSSQKNKSISPINSKKNDKLYNNINEIKYRNKLANNQINNFNINFNNVFFTSSKPTSYIIDNNNKNISNSQAYSSINVNKNLINDSLNHNLSKNNFINSNNILEQVNKERKNIYVMNLKNLYNFSRNRNNILINNYPLSQTEISRNKIQNNNNIIHIQKNNNIKRNKQMKTILERCSHGNSNYFYVKQDTNFNIKNQVQINKNNKIQQDNQKKQNEIMNFIHKVQANFIMRNKNRNNLEIMENNKVINTGIDELNKNIFKYIKSFIGSKKNYSSSISRRKNKSKIDINYKGQKIHDKKSGSLGSQKNIGHKHKRKIK